jgi:hypothetical protein
VGLAFTAACRWEMIRGRQPKSSMFLASSRRPF